MEERKQVRPYVEELVWATEWVRKCVDVGHKVDLKDVYKNPDSVYFGVYSIPYSKGYGLPYRKKWLIGRKDPQKNNNNLSDNA